MSVLSLSIHSYYWRLVFDIFKLKKDAAGAAAGAVVALHYNQLSFLEFGVQLSSSLASSSSSFSSFLLNPSLRHLNLSSLGPPTTHFFVVIAISKRDKTDWRWWRNKISCILKLLPNFLYFYSLSLFLTLYHLRHMWFNKRKSIIWKWA